MFQKGAGAISHQEVTAGPQRIAAWVAAPYASTSSGLMLPLCLCAVCAVVSLVVRSDRRAGRAPVMHGRPRQMGLEHGRNFGHVAASTAEYDVLDLVRPNLSVSQYSIGLR